VEETTAFGAEGEEESMDDRGSRSKRRRANE